MRKFWSSATGIGDAASVFVILILATLFFATWASAQTPPPCMPFAEWKAALEGARPAQKMIGLGPVGNTHVVMFWASQGGTHWTILSADATGKTCAMAAGADWDQGRIPGIGERDA
jgi:hypothetical protein